MGHRCPQQPSTAGVATAATPTTASQTSQKTRALYDGEGSYLNGGQHNYGSDGSTWGSQHLQTHPGWSTARKPEPTVVQYRRPPSLPATIDYGNRHQYSEHRIKQQQKPRQLVPSSWWLSLDLLLIWTLLPKATQWTDKKQHNTTVPVATISNSSERRTPTEARSTASIVSACRVQHQHDTGDQWSVKHKSLLLLRPTPSYRCFPIRHNPPKMVARSVNERDPIVETISEFNFTLPTPLPATVPLRMGERPKGAEVTARYTPFAVLLATVGPSTSFGQGFQFNEIIL